MDQPKQRVTIEPVAGMSRRVRVCPEILGTAYGLPDVLEFLRRAGLDPDLVDLVDRELFDWRGGGPDVWT